MNRNTDSYSLDSYKKNSKGSITGYINYGLEAENDSNTEYPKKDFGSTDIETKVVASLDLDKVQPEPEVPKKQQSCLRQYAGMMLTLSASLLFSVIVLLVKLLGAEPYKVDPGNVSFWRYAGITIPSLPLLLYFNSCGRRKTEECPEGESVFRTIWPLTDSAKLKTFIGLLIRGFLGCFSVIFRYYALRYISIGDASVISYSSPVVVTILAHFFLGEKTGVIPIFACLMTLGGVFIILRPPFITGESLDEDTIKGTSFALGSLLCNSIMTVITRKIREVQFSLMLVVFGAIGMIQAFCMSLSDGGLRAPVQLEDTLMLSGVFAMSFFGQMCILLALKFEQAGPVALIRTCDVIFGFLLQYAFLNVIPDVYSGIGGGVVFFCILLIATRKWMSTLPKHHPARESCFVKFILL